MRNILFTIFSVALATIFTACSSNTVEDIASVEESEGKITATLRNYEVDDTRTTHIYSSTGMDFSWESSDQLGCFPTSVDPSKASTQILTPISVSGSQANFGRAGDINIKSNTEYTAYYRYKPENEGKSYKAIPVSYIGQVQHANAEVYYRYNSANGINDAYYKASEAAASKHLGDFNYMTSAKVTSAEISAELHFDMKQLQSIVRFNIQVPEDNEHKPLPLTYNRIDVVNNDAEFTVAGTVDITDDSRAINTSGDESNKSHNISLGLSGTGFNFGENNTKILNGGKGYIIAYMMVAPVTLTTSSYFYLTGTNGAGDTKCFKATLTPKTIGQGKAYVWTINNSVEDPIILDEITVEEWQEATGYENEGGVGTQTW